MRFPAGSRRIAATCLAFALLGADAPSPEPSAAPSPDATALLAGTLTPVAASEPYQYPSPKSVVAAGGAVWASEGENGRIARFAPDGSFDEFTVKRGLTVGTMTAGPDGSVWFCDDDGDTIGRVLPGGVTALVHLKAGTHARALTVAHDGSVWIAGSGAGIVAHLNPDTGAVRTLGGFGRGFQPEGIATAPDGKIWIADAGNDALVRMTANGTQRATFPVRHPQAHPQTIVAGADGNMWVSLNRADGLERATPAGALKFFALKSPGGHDPKYDSIPFDIAAAKDGIWIVEESNDSVLRLSYAGKQTSLSTAFESAPWGIARGNDGRVWFTQNERSVVARVNADNTISEFSLVPKSADREFVPSAASLAPDGDVWLLDRRRQSVGVLSGTAFAEVNQWPSEPSLGLFGIAAAPDGSAWVTEQDAGVVSHVERDGTEIGITLPTHNAKPSDIAVAGDGVVWVAESAKVARIATDASVSELPLARKDDAPIRVAPDRSGGAFVVVWGAAAHYLERVEPGVAAKTVLTFPASVTDANVAIDAAGNVWFSTNDGGVTRLSPDGTHPQTRIHIAGTDAAVLAAGADGTLWIGPAEASASGEAIASMHPDGRAATIKVPTASTASQFVALPDGSAWFLEKPHWPMIGNPTIGKVDATGHVTEYAIR